MFEPRDIENPIAEEDFREQIKKEKDDNWDLITKLFDGRGEEDEQRKYRKVI